MSLNPQTGRPHDYSPATVAPDNKPVVKPCYIGPADAADCYLIADSEQTQEHVVNADGFPCDSHTFRGASAKFSPLIYGQIKFQTGRVTEANPQNGCTIEDVLAVALDRLRTVDVRLPCAENAVAIAHIEAAIAALSLRQSRRHYQGVQGLNEAHK